MDGAFLKAGAGILGGAPESWASLRGLGGLGRRGRDHPVETVGGVVTAAVSEEELCLS